MSGNPTRVMVVDDSLVYRRLLTEVIDEIAGVEVCASAPDGLVALERLETTACDLVLLDVLMPEMDGVETLRQIKKLHPNVDVVMVSAVSQRAVEETLKALEIGAVEFVAKPETKDAATSRQQLVQMLRPILSHCRTQRNLARAHQLLPATTGETQGRRVPSVALRTRKVSIVVIGVSTGGPSALAQVLPDLDVDLPAPVVVIQHMPGSFTQSLAERLNRRARLRVVEAADGHRLQTGSVLIAPGGRHLTLRRIPAAVSRSADGARTGIPAASSRSADGAMTGVPAASSCGADGARTGSEQLVVKLDDGPPVNGCRPSVDVCLLSLTGQADGAILSVTMTGMGRDGVEGVRSIKSHRAGGYSIVQTVASSVAPSMPRAVVEAGLADEVLPLCWVAQRINDLVKHGAWGR